jgi:hypothetical protein
MNRLVSSLLVLAALAAPATAFADEVRFLVVNSVRTGASNFTDNAKTLIVTGRTATSDQPVTRELHPYQNDDPSGRWADCQRMALIAMNKPGKWFLDVTYSRSSATWLYLTNCTLVRNDPPPPQ